MSTPYFENKVYTFNAAVPHQLTKGTYDGCRFNHCNFIGTNLADFRFLECEFHNCQLDRVELTNTSLTVIKFIDCKMMGISFEHCHRVIFTPHFENCLLNYSNFFQCKMPGTVFSNCNLTEVDFTEAMMPECIFNGCDFTNARFDKTNLSKADFRGAFNFLIDPEKNHLKKAKFSLSTIQGLLYKYGLMIEG